MQKLVATKNFYTTDTRLSNSCVPNQICSLELLMNFLQVFTNLAGYDLNSAEVSNSHCSQGMAKG